MFDSASTAKAVRPQSTRAIGSTPTVLLLLWPTRPWTPSRAGCPWHFYSQARVPVPLPKAMAAFTPLEIANLEPALDLGHMGSACRLRHLVPDCRSKRARK